MAERSVCVGHTTLNRWVVKYAPAIADEAAAPQFFRRTIDRNGWPDKVVIDKSGANLAGLDNMNIALILAGWYWLFETLQVKYLNNIIEQDPRFIKKITRPMKGFNPLTPLRRRWPGLRLRA